MKKKCFERLYIFKIRIHLIAKNVAETNELVRMKVKTIVIRAYLHVVNFAFV